MKRPLIDSAAKNWLATHGSLLENTFAPQDIDPATLEAISFTGGHGVMADFTDTPALHNLTARLYEDGKIVAAVCHGYCGLLNIKLSDGSYLIAGKNLQVLAELKKNLPVSLNLSPIMLKS